MLTSKRSEAEMIFKGGKNSNSDGDSGHNCLALITKPLVLAANVRYNEAVSRSARHDSIFGEISRVKNCDLCLGTKAFAMLLSKLPDENR